MATTTEVPVQTTATPLPLTLTTTRTTVIVENRGPESIWVSYSPDVAAGLGHEVATNTAREFGGAPCWAVTTTTNQAGGPLDTTIVSELP